MTKASSTILSDLTGWLTKTQLADHYKLPVESPSIQRIVQTKDSKKSEPRRTCRYVW